MYRIIVNFQKTVKSKILLLRKNSENMIEKRNIDLKK